MYQSQSWSIANLVFTQVFYSYLVFTQNHFIFASGWGINTDCKLKYTCTVHKIKQNQAKLS